MDYFVAKFVPGTTGHFVFKTHVSNQPGEHWLSVSASTQLISYLDSYGQHLSTYGDVYATLRKESNCSGRRLEWNRIMLQGPLSTVCGDYCVLFCIAKAKGWTMKEIVTVLTSQQDPHTRDHTVRLNLKRKYPTLMRRFLTKRSVGSGRDSVHIPGANIDLA